MTSTSSAANSTNMSAGANITPKTADLATQQSATSTSSTSAVATDAASKPLPNTGDSTTVTLSNTAKDKLAAEQGAAKTSAAAPALAENAQDTDKTAEPAKAEKAADEDGGDIESFVFGALGLDHPEEIDENGDPSYSAGQYVKAAATVGGMIAMFI
ncbi:hypothetical protein MSG37_05685 [Shewanella sp. 1CM18E]|uniref:hypothetical protein n=1 Tax=Shewanella sp. 1CM18E TaxID=2929169 RepID=UPI0020BFA844|nr:hypothetical protein [Shewanella sp. 1CM18E]MCK8044367.1 hypothetical protein [Shewanella sp. 1CM18E]